MSLENRSRSLRASRRLPSIRWSPVALALLVFSSISSPASRSHGAELVGPVVLPSPLPDIDLPLGIFVPNSPDFDGDGYADMPVGVPRETLGGNIDAGAVNVIYGSPGGLAVKWGSLWSRATAGILGGIASSDGFGSAIAWGDFNKDGEDDLAIGAPWDNIGAVSNAGGVNVIYGSPAGLTAVGDQFWTQNSAGIADISETSDAFGAALAVGDFNGDGRADLAIGVPYEDVGAINEAGAVNVIYGSAAGLTSISNQLWHQNTLGVRDLCEAFDHFGAALTAGDFNNDGKDDLAIGVPYEAINGQDNAGAVNVLYGSAAGLTAAGNQFWHQDQPGIEGVAEGPIGFSLGDLFGLELTTGDFNNDGRDDLAVGAPSEAIGAALGAGSVNVIYGSAAGLTAAGDQIFYQDIAGVLDTSEQWDYFASGLAAGDFNNDGRDDLAIGVPGENFEAGAVHVILGSNLGLTTAGNQLWRQDSAGIEGASQAGDHFGAWLMCADFDDDGRADLVVASPCDVVSGVQSGSVNVIFGAAAGLSAAGDEIWNQNSPGVADVSESQDHFGANTHGDC